MDNKEKKKKGIDEMSTEEKMDEYLRIKLEEKEFEEKGDSFIGYLLIIYAIGAIIFLIWAFCRH